jgi:hypothetical protein
MAELNLSLIFQKAVPRILKAVIWGSLTFLIVYYLPMMFYPQDILPIDYITPLIQFAAIAVFFAVAGQLFSGTIIGCGFGVARAIVMIAYFFMVSEGGVFSITLPFGENIVNLAFDLSLFLLMIIAVNLLGIAKNILEAISILSEDTNEINPTLN